MIERVADAGHLLVACDFDGTLAPIVDDPDAATPIPRAMAALSRLSSAPATTVAIVSGRLRSELLARFDADLFSLVGEHGADPGRGSPTEPEVLSAARKVVEEVAASTPGSSVEHKIRSVVFHYRRASDPAPALEGLRSAAMSRLADLTVIEGKNVFELTAADEDKGSAIDDLRHCVGADAVLFLGDDVTDEAVFKRLRPNDLGVKVGPGPSAATHRVPHPEAVAELLEAVADRREKR